MAQRIFKPCTPNTTPDPGFLRRSCWKLSASEAPRSTSQGCVTFADPAAQLYPTPDLHVWPRGVGEENVLELQSALGLPRLGSLLGEGVDVERLVREAEDFGGGLLALTGIRRVRADLKIDSSTKQHRKKKEHKQYWGEQGRGEIV